jgi:hypothetical protein
VVDHHGEAFGTNLANLWEMATMDMPGFIQGSVKAGNSITGIESFQVAGGDGTKRLVSAWVDAGVHLRAAVTQSVQNTYDACDALLQIVDIYAEADHGNAASLAFASRRDDEINKHAHDYPPTVFPTPASRPRVGGEF